MWIGVAIGIPEPYRAVLTRARVEAGDPKARLIPPHVTLLPPTKVPAARLGEVEAHLGEVAANHEPFVVRLSGTESFRPVSPVVFVALESGQEECAALQASVNAGLVEQTLRFPFHPHVTIAHEVSEEQLDHAQVAMGQFEADFPVAAFELYQHGEDEVWREIARFPLKGDEFPNGAG